MSDSCQIYAKVQISELFKKILLVHEIESKIREVFVNICKLVHEYIIHISDMVLFNKSLKDREIAKIRVIFFSGIDLALSDCR